MVHKYRTYKDPFRHPALRGGGGGSGVISKLLSLVARAMAIAQLTHLHISIPASGSAVGAVPEECFPSVPLPRVSMDPRRVSSPVRLQFCVLPRNRSSCLIRCQWTYRIFRFMTRSIPVFRRRIIWTSLPRFRIRTFRAPSPTRFRALFMDESYWGDQAVIRLCLTFPGMNRIRLPRQTACWTLLWDIHLPIYHDRY